MGRFLQASVSVGIIASFILGATCFPSPPLPTAQIVGEQGETVLYTRPFDSVTGLPMETPLYRMRLADGQRELLTDSVPWTALSDGDYVAWPDDDARVLRVENLATGDQQQYLADVGTLDYYSARVDAIDNTRMLASYSAGFGIYLQSYYRLIDLATGGERDLSLLDDSFDTVYAFHLGTDHLAYFADPLDDTEPLYLELAVRLEVFDLATDERTVVVQGMRVGQGPFIADGRVVWSQLKSGTMKSRIKAYDLVEKKTSTLVEDLDSADQTAYLEDFDGTYLLITRQTTTDLGIFSFVTGDSTLELMPLDGSSKTIASAPGSQWDLEFDQARLIDHYVVWLDHTTNELVVYDIATSFIHRYPLFAE